MQTLTIDVINEKALPLLQDLEVLQLIRVRRDDEERKAVNWSGRYKGAMTRQPIADIDSQLKELRDAWE